MIYSKTDRVANKMLKIIRESQLIEEEIPDMPQSTITDDSKQADSQVSHLPIPINEHTFPGVLAAEENKISQKLNVKFEDNPFIYNPSSQTVSFTALIPTMSNLRFYYTNDISTSLSDGCFIFATAMVLNEESLKNLNIIKSHFEIFSEDWKPSAIKEKLRISKSNLNRFQEEYSGMKFFKP
jgi:hypothetical protein